MSLSSTVSCLSVEVMARVLAESRSRAASAVSARISSPRLAEIRLD